jgi:hypothetical protein
LRLISAIKQSRALARLKGVRSLIISGELVACDGDG